MLSSIHVQITPHIIIIIEDSTWEFNVNIKIAIAYQTKDIRNVLSHCINDQVWDIFITANTYISVIPSLFNPCLYMAKYFGIKYIDRNMMFGIRIEIGAKLRFMSNSLR